MRTSQWIRPFLFTLLLLIAPFIGYYVYYVDAREAFLVDRFHAHLANAAVQTEARFSSAFNVMRTNCGRANDLGVGACKTPPASQEAPKLGVSRADGGLLFRETVNSQVAEAGVDLDILIGNLDPERQFYDVVILDEANGVVYQRGEANGRIGDNGLFAQSAGEKESDDSGYTVSDSLADMRAVYRGQPFLIFTQPLQIRTSSGKAWRVAALLEEGRFNGLKYGVPLAGLSLAVLIVLSVLFASPFLKLWFLGRFESLSRFDIVLQTAAGLSLVAMVTVALLAWNTSARMSAYFDDRLESISNDIRGAIRGEFGVAATTLGRLEPEMIGAYYAAQGGHLRRSTKVECPTIAESYEEAPRAISEGGAPTLGGDLLAGLPEQTRDYRQLVMAYVMDQNGCQIVKWSSALQWTTPGRFADRAYFTRTLPDERVLPNLYAPDLPSGPKFPFYQEFILSRTTGEREVVFSKPVSDASPCTEALRNAALDARDGTTAEASERVPCVSVVSGKLRALESILPHGFGIMLLDGDMNIVARADGDASSELNLASEIDAPASLRALAGVGAESGAPTSSILDADYRRAPHRLLVAPLEFGDLVLVSYYDRNLVVRTMLESVGAAVVAWLLWTSALITLALFFRIADDMTERALRRQPVALGLTLLALLIVAWIFLAVPRSVLSAAAAIPALLSLLPLITRERTPGIVAARRPLIVTAVWLSTVLAAALPMYVFYRAAERGALSALARFEAHEQARDETRQRESFEAWKAKVGLTEVDGWTGFAAWKNQTLLRPQFDLRTPEGSSPEECRFTDIVCRVLRNVPDYNADVAGIHSMYRTADYDADSLDRLHRELLGTPFAARAFHLFVIGAFLAMTGVGIWYLLVKAFSLRVEDAVRLDSFSAPGPKDFARVIVYGVPAPEKRHRYHDALPATSRAWLDLRDAASETKGDLGTADVVALDEFDANLNDVEVVRSRTELLEQLLREQRKGKLRVIVLFVSTEPLNFVTATHNAEKDLALLTRFAAALAQFKLTYYEPKKDIERQQRRPVSLKERWRTMASTLRDWRRSPTHDERDREIERQARAKAWRRKLVADECRHPELRAIGIEMSRLVDAHQLSKAQIIQQIQNRASAIYQYMWSRCTRVEKFTLMELARGNPINPNNWDAARRLRMRGYVRTAPFYRIASENLRQFVIRMERTENVESWRSESPGAWNQIKVPLVVMFAGTLIFLALTQPNLFNSMFAFLAAGAASFPFLVSALSARLQQAAKGGGS